MKEKYTGSDITLIIPTKDRPHKVKNLLASLTVQTEKVGRIIIIDGGKSIKNVVEEFQGKLPVEHYKCNPPGQIRQRNMGIQKLAKDCRLAGSIDDDIVFEKDSIEKMISFWNEVEPETAGIGFNTTNEGKNSHFFILDILQGTSSVPGKVLRSGKGTSICNIDKSIRTYWLNGGATIWKAEFLRRIEHKEINCRYAVFEDIIFSYPIGKEFPLYVCAEAQVIHDHEIHTGALTLAQFFYRGKTQALWQLYFVTQHKELSLFYYLAGYVFPNTLTLFLRMVKKKPSQSPFFHLGRIVGAITGLLALLRGTDFQAFLSEECSS